MLLTQVIQNNQAWLITELFSYFNKNISKINNSSTSSSRNRLSSTSAAFTTRRRKSKPRHRHIDNASLSSIMKQPKYSPSSSITEAELCKLLEVSNLDTAFRLSSSLPPTLRYEPLHESSERHPLRSNSLRSASPSASDDYQYWIPKGVEFCDTTELYLYNK